VALLLGIISPTALRAQNGPINGTAELPGSASTPFTLSSEGPTNGSAFREALDSPKNPFSASLTIGQDSFFGFYPILNGYYDITDRLQFSFYGQFWTTPSFSTTGSGGSGLWTEIGIGFNLKLEERKLSINPQIAALNGVLLSGAAQPLAFEGIVPTVTINRSGIYTEGQLYAGYYLATAAPRTNDFIHWWINGGVKPFAEAENFLSIVSVGAHFEQLFRTRFRLGSGSNLYTWIGPYTQFKLPNGVYLRLSAGWDTQNTFSDCFYKAMMGFSF
jgi:hypothetical protein